MSRKIKNASDVVRMVEEKLALAALLRKEITRLSALCEENEKSARSIAISHLGDEKGDLAYQLALATIPSDPDLINSSVLDEYRRTLSSKTVSPSPATSPVEEGATRDRETEGPRPAEKKAAVPKAARNSTLFGVQVPLARQEEAEAVVMQAKDAARAGGGKKNPYQGDRGKNAWRKKLFNAAYDFESEISQAGTSTREAELTQAPEAPPSLPSAEREEPLEQVAQVERQEPRPEEATAEVSAPEEEIPFDEATLVKKTAIDKGEPLREAENEASKTRLRHGLGIPIPGPTSLTQTGSRPPIPSFLRK